MSSLTKEAAQIHTMLKECGLENPLQEKILDLEIRTQKIKKHITEIMQLLHLDLSDDSLIKTPYRIAKMYVDEIFSGLDYANFPKITIIKNKMKVNEMITIRDITFTSTCEHHFMSIDGKANISYIPHESIIGLSKINRIVQFFCASSTDTRTSNSTNFSYFTSFTWH